MQRIIGWIRQLLRPAWCVGVLFFDLNVFSGAWPLSPDSRVESCFWLVNFLVLGFLFGERSLANLLPLAAAWMGRPLSFPPTGTERAKAVPPSD